MTEERQGGSGTTDSSGIARRSREVSWSDPQALSERVRQMSREEVLQGLVRGNLPAPAAVGVLGIDFAAFEPGRAECRLAPQESHCNLMGIMHGGVVSTLADTALGCAILTRLPEGMAQTTLELKVNFVRAVTLETGTLRCIAEALHVGRRVATAQARVVDDAERLYAHATTTCLVIPHMPAD